MMFDNTILQTKDFFHFEYTHLVDSKEEFFKEPSNEYKGSIIQINDEQVVDEEIIKKKTQNKQKYQKMKRRLTSLCSQHQDKCLIKDNREVSSPNKSRILTLAIEFEKNTLNQTKDYQLLETKLKEIQKILDHKRQHDLLILKQSRFIPAFSFLLKKVPSFHKNQFNQAVKCIELGLRLLRVFCTLSSNRDYMILTNQLVILNSSLSCFLGKDERKLALQCLNILHEILCGRIKADSEQIIILTLQIVFFGQLSKKLRSSIEICMNQEGIVDEEFVLKCLKYIYMTFYLTYKKNLQIPLYEQSELPPYMQSNLDSFTTFFQALLISILLEKDGTIRQEELSISTINISLYILKLINLHLHINVQYSQKLIQNKKKSPFVQALKHLFEYSKKSVNEGEQLHEITSLCTEIIIYMGKLCFNSSSQKNSLRQNGLLQSLYNHPLVYLMDQKLKYILMPTLCSVMDEDKDNMCKFLEESCSDGIIEYIRTQTKAYEQKQESINKYKEEQTFTTTTIQQQMPVKSLTRKSSVSSLNSYTTQCTQNSYSTSLPFNDHKRNNKELLTVLPFWKWGILMEELKNLDD